MQAEPVQELAAKLRRLPTDFCSSDQNKPKERGFFKGEAFQDQTGLNPKLGVLVAPSLSVKLIQLLGRKQVDFASCENATRQH